MRRTVVVGLAALMIAGGLGVAPPAHASNPLPCVEDAPPSPGLGTVYVDENGIVHVQPEAAPGDVDAYVGWSVEWSLFMIFCLESRLPTGGVWCEAGLALGIVESMDPLDLYLRYVYREGSGFAINVPLLRSDAAAATSCVL
ncbi:MAG TPA: hypothetical protein VHJ76_02215, partial [Actinomycetota bacterium]|nr:hypothetical protein [Actinomycetota bacterium]